MVLRVIKPIKDMKVYNQEWLKRRPKSVKRATATKKECEKEVAPLCRSIDLLVAKNERTKLQVGCDQEHALVSVAQP